MYVYDKTYNKWISLNTSTLYCDAVSLGYDTAGTHEVGYNKNYFYGSSGLPVEDQKLYDASVPEKITGTIKQAETPDFEKPKFSSVDIKISANSLTINWSIDPNSTPCYNYRISICFKSAAQYMEIHSSVIYRPEVTSYVYESTSNIRGYYQIKVTCDAVSNESVTETLYRDINAY